MYGVERSSVITDITRKLADCHKDGWRVVTIFKDPSGDYIAILRRATRLERWFG